MTDNTGATLSLGDKVVVIHNYTGKAFGTNFSPTQTLQVGHIVKFTPKNAQVYVRNTSYNDWYKVERDRRVENELITIGDWETLSSMFSTTLLKSHHMIKVS